MLRTNLSTRPFYNERGVHWVLALAAVALVALTIFNVQRVLTLSRQQARLGEAIERDESRARGLTTEASRVRSSIDRASLEQVILAAREANSVIDERTFSWTELFNYIESTLPANVMLTAVQPRVDPDGVFMSMTVVGREVEHVDEFIENLEKTGAFTGVLATAEQVTDEGTFQVVLSGAYHPPAIKTKKDAPADEKAAEPSDSKPEQGTAPKPSKPVQEGA